MPFGAADGGAPVAAPRRASGTVREAPAGAAACGIGVGEFPDVPAEVGEGRAGNVSTLSTINMALCLTVLLAHPGRPT